MTFETCQSTVISSPVLRRMLSQFPYLLRLELKNTGERGLEEIKDIVMTYLPNLRSLTVNDVVSHGRHSIALKQ